MKQRSAKELAQRIDPTYHQRPHLLRRARFWLSVGMAALVVLAVGGALLAGKPQVLASGPLSRAHRFLSAECATCHVEPFRAVQDASCQSCHMVAPHVGPTREGEPSCAACHAEHRGRAALVDVTDASCNICHADHKGIDSFASHRSFAVVPQEQHITFSHKGHLAQGLACAACHQPDAAGRGFLPIEFASHCASCHTEPLDPKLPERTVPHGLQPGPLREALEAAYLAEMRRNEAFAAELGRTTPIPGQGSPATPEWATAIATRATQNLNALLGTNGRSCLLCHTKSQAGKIVPPQIPNRWFSKARFQHDTHRTTSCATCHDMETATTANDLMLPTQKRCTDCHHDNAARTTCATCHPYHEGTHGLGRSPAAR